MTRVSAPEIASSTRHSTRHKLAPDGELRRSAGSKKPGSHGVTRAPISRRKDQRLSPNAWDAPMMGVSPSSMLLNRFRPPQYPPPRASIAATHVHRSSKRSAAIPFWQRRIVGWQNCMNRPGARVSALLNRHSGPGSPRVTRASCRRTGVTRLHSRSLRRSHRRARRATLRTDGWSEP